MTSPLASPSHDSPPGNPEDKPGRDWRVFVVPAVLALLGYVGFYACDARLRSRNGPWEVQFIQSTEGTPALRIAQPSLGIHDVEVRFEGETLASLTNPLPAVVRFDQPLATVPFGRTAFDDLMYLPGTVVLHCFGHEVQLVPSKLYLNRRGFAWTNDIRYDLQPGAKLPTLDPPPKPKKKRKLFG